MNPSVWGLVPRRQYKRTSQTNYYNTDKNLRTFWSESGHLQYSCIFTEAKTTLLCNTFKILETPIFDFRTGIQVSHASLENATQSPPVWRYQEPNSPGWINKMLAAYQACAVWSSRLSKKQQIPCVTNMPCKQSSKRHTFHTTRTEEDSWRGITRLNFRNTSNRNGDVARMGRIEMHTQFRSANLHALRIDGKTILKRLWAGFV
jgi:hypothetical protein